MRLGKMKRIFGGMTGAIIAIAGGLGVAVGTYTLPDPRHAHVGLDVYGPGMNAIAVWEGDVDGVYTEVRISTRRFTYVREHATVGPDGSANSHGGHDIATQFIADVQTCPPPEYEGDEAFCNWTQWITEEFPPASFEFDPTLGAARVTGTADCNFSSDCPDGDPPRCDFDIQWTGTGEAAPIASFGQNGGHDPGNTHLQYFGSAEVSRVAPATIDACFGSIADARGYLSVGSQGFGGQTTVH